MPLTVHLKLTKMEKGPVTLEMNKLTTRVVGLCGNQKYS